MIEILRENPLLLLFLVAGIGYPLGRIRIGEVRIGVAAMLFVGLVFGALDPALEVPEPLYQLGLTLFIHALGISSGPGFVRSLKGKGLRDIAFVLVMILFTVGLMLMPHYLLDLSPAQTAGLFAGSLTSTPSLAAVLDYLRIDPAGGSVAEAVVGYSIAYPVSILGMILCIVLAQRVWRIDYAAEARSLRDLGAAQEPLTSLTIRVTSDDAIGKTVPELMLAHRWQVIFGRVQRGEHQYVAGAGTVLQRGDLVTAVGTKEELARVIDFLGTVSPIEVDMDRTEVDTRRIFVSDPHVAGLRIKDLNLPHRFGAVITRVGRGDQELLPPADLRLELGDRVRVLTKRNNLAEVAHFFGDSYRSLSEVDVMTLGLGLALGLALGQLPIPLPGGLVVKLGSSGGPLVVALILGAMARTGPLVWSLPYSANLLLRQIGLSIFLAGVGVRSGYEFFETVLQGNGLVLLAAAAAVVLVAGMTMLFVGYRLLKIPMGVLVGMLAALQTQAATLGFAQEQTHNELPNLGYATVYPAAVIIKIVLAQSMMVLLS